MTDRSIDQLSEHASSVHASIITRKIPSGDCSRESSRGRRNFHVAFRGTARRIAIFPINKRVYTPLTIVPREEVKKGKTEATAAGTLFAPVLGNIAEGTSVRSFLCLPEDPPA